jgi:threonine dehydratase
MDGDSSPNSEPTTSEDCSPSERLVSFGDIEQAHTRINDVVNHTPLDTSRTFAERSGAASIGLKLETFQRTGSFKIRGAYNKMSQLSHEKRQAGVITSSAGNHAQGVALAGSIPLSLCQK